MLNAWKWEQIAAFANRAIVSTYNLGLSLKILKCWIMENRQTREQINYSYYPVIFG